MNISGINSLMFYKTPHQNILLLGEAHIVGNCPPEKENVISVGNYVNKIFLLKPDDKCLDFFTEFPTRKSFRKKRLNVIPYYSGLDEAYDFLFPLSRIKKFRTRLHFIDSRRLDKNAIDANEINKIFRGVEINTPYSPDESYEIAISDKKCEDYDFEELESEQEIIQRFVEVVTIEDLFHVIAYLIDINPEINRDYFIKFVRALEFFSGVKFFTSHQDLQQWEEEYFKILRKELSKMDTSIISVSDFKKYLLKANLEFGYDYYTFYSGIISCVTTIPMDAYTLSRLFIKFKEDKPERPCNEQPITHAIIHTGSYHTQIYDNFLQQVFGSPEIRVGNTYTDDLCREVPEFDFWEW